MGAFQKNHRSSTRQCSACFAEGCRGHGTLKPWQGVHLTTVTIKRMTCTIPNVQLTAPKVGFTYWPFAQYDLESAEDHRRK